jgi:hypothetical protein
MDYQIFSKWEEGKGSKQSKSGVTSKTTRGMY